MRFLSAVIALLAFGSLGLAEEDAPKKRGGFTGATPKPLVKKSGTPSATPSPKKHSQAADDDDPPAPKSSAKKVKSAAQDDDEQVEKPATKKRATAPKDADADVADKPATKKKATEAESKSAATKPTDSELSATPIAKQEHAPAATVAPEDLAEFAAQPPRVQALITAALELTKLNLTYTYGSADPAQGGMDCSGVMYFLLRGQGFKEVPRDSSSQYVWARKAGPFFAVVSKSAESFEFKDLRPGDLLFWTGTYETGREIPISHVMLYLGTEKKTKKRVMFGSSDGRSYNGVQRWGVSVFDFKMPKADPANPERAKVDFVGYGRIPELFASNQDGAAAEQAAAREEPKEPTVSKPAEPKPKPTTRSKSARSSGKRTPTE